ncbi:hypothetical protein PT276_06605 [Orbaceae bacterium ESL0721]|nr:hypothetical protein [Orbaceae bacterium ESL0721]
MELTYLLRTTLSLRAKPKPISTNYGQNSSNNTAIDRPSQVITTNGDITDGCWARY